MVYLLKYLKYKNKYLNLKNQHGGSTSKIPKEMIIEYLTSKGITNFNDLIPTSILESNTFLKVYEYFRWNNIIGHGWLRYDFENLKESLEKYFNTISTIPEIIIPTENLNFLDWDIDDFDLSRMTARYVKSDTDTRKYQFEMTHLLFEKDHRSNRYVLSALYYYTPDDINKKNIIEILTEYYKHQMFRRQNIGFDDDDEEAKKLKIKFGNKLEILSKSDFLTTPKYIRVGKLYFKKVDQTSIFIEDIDTWIMRAGSGLQMICSLLKIFLPEYNKISLEAGPFKVIKYWEKLGFKHTGHDSFVNTDISNTILSKCIPLASNVKLIIKSSKENYTTDLEAVKASIN